MKLSKLNNAPVFIKKEIVEIQKRITPNIRKGLIYAILAIALVTFSTLRLFFHLIETPGNDLSIPIILLSVIGALGFALLKESVYKKREIEVKCVEYMLERVKHSKCITDESKLKFIGLIDKNPANAFQIFCIFLSQEESSKKRGIC